MNKGTSVAMDADFLVTRSLSFLEVSSDFIAFWVLSLNFRDRPEPQSLAMAAQIFEIDINNFNFFAKYRHPNPSIYVDQNVQQVQAYYRLHNYQVPLAQLQGAALSIAPWVLDDL